jgi:predicted dehydrogenase
MRFALLGDHPDGLDMARALVDSGRHELLVYVGPLEGAEQLRRWNVVFKPVGDLEEGLADPTIEGVIVAGKAVHRPDQLRRALQSDRHVLCVQPVDATPDTAYEASLIQGDTRKVLLPLYPESLHPGIQRLAELVRTASSGLGAIRLIEIERWSIEQVLGETGSKRRKPALPGWNVLRVLGGEIAEVCGFASGPEVKAADPLLLSGRFEDGCLFQAVYLSSQFEAHWRLTVVGSYSLAELLFPRGWPGPARLTWRDESGQHREESWDLWNPWPELVKVFEEALAEMGEERRQRNAETRRHRQSDDVFDSASGPLPVSPSSPLAWQAAVRSLELDDAARLSVEKRRTSAMEYQDATEEASFKGTMTLVGCALLWVSLLLLMLSVWLPWAGWLIVPLFAMFLLLQMLRWGIRKPDR